MKFMATLVQYATSGLYLNQIEADKMLADQILISHNAVVAV